MRQSTASKSRKIQQRELDVSCHRLSKPANKLYEPPPKPEPYAKKYFDEHPEQLEEIQKPQEKLDAYDEDEGNDEKKEGEKQSQIEKLIKKKVLHFLLTGEGSEELLDCHIEIANYYNDNDQPESALRHYSNAQKIAKEREDTTRDDEIKIGQAEAHFNNRSADAANVRTANRLVSSLDEDSLDDALNFRRKLLLARILAYNGDHSGAAEIYSEILYDFDSEIPDEAKRAALYAEVGREFLLVKDYDVSKEAYTKSHDLYKKLGKDYRKEEAATLKQLQKIDKQQEESLNQTEQTEDKEEPEGEDDNEPQNQDDDDARGENDDEQNEEDHNEPPPKAKPVQSAPPPPPKQDVPTHLHIQIVEGTDLPKTDTIGKIDPYVVISLQGTSIEFRTKTIDNNDKPTWNETFTIPIGNIKKDVVLFTLKDEDIKFDDLVSTYSLSVQGLEQFEFVDEWYDFSPAEGVKKGGKIHFNYMFTDQEHSPF